MIVAIDGPAGSGKSTTARRIAERIGFVYIDTGAMYRAITLIALRNKTDITEQALADLLARTTVELQRTEQGQRTLLNGEDVSERIRMPDVTAHVSAVSAQRVVREAMVEQQRRLGNVGNILMDGRDIGTAVFPHADLKIFLIASVETRAARRLRELAVQGIESSFEDMCADIGKRDTLDSEREISPLRKASDAIEIDTSLLTIEEQVAEIIRLIQEKQ
jgi:CMP/dCMP kinase